MNLVCVTNPEDEEFFEVYASRGEACTEMSKLTGDAWKAVSLNYHFGTLKKKRCSYKGHNVYERLRPIQKPRHRNPKNNINKTSG